MKTMRQFVKCMVSSNNRDVCRSSVYFLTSKSLAKPHLNTSQVGYTVLLHKNRLNNEYRQYLKFYLK